MKLSKKLSALILAAAFTALPLMANAQQPAEDKPIVLKTMGSLFFGGTVQTLPNGETFHGDHGYAQFYIPQNARTYPLIMWHGIGQSGRTYESTPDGREGYMAILPRRDWPVYIIDQPRRGRAGYTASKVDMTNAVPTITSESGVWDAFRNGLWLTPEKPYFFPVSQFPKTPDAVDQFFRQQTPDTGAEPRTREYYQFMANTMAQLLKQTGPAVLITHSNSGKYGWYSGIADPQNIKAIVAYEPGACVFPSDDIPKDLTPSPLELVNDHQGPLVVPPEEFNRLTKMPILIIYGDNIAKEKSDNFNSEVWRISKHRAQQMVERINSRGGDAKVLSLPDIGIKGNTHAPFADLNNLEIAKILEGFLHEKGLDGRENPHRGPQPKGLTEYTIPLAQ